MGYKINIKQLYVIVGLFPDVYKFDFIPFVWLLTQIHQCRRIENIIV